MYRSINHGADPDANNSEDEEANYNIQNDGPDGAPRAPRPERDGLRDDLLVNNDGVEDPEAAVRTWCFNLVRER